MALCLLPRAHMLHDFGADLSAAFGTWRRRLALSAIILATLSLAIGAAVGVFGVGYAVLWRPLDVPQPDRVVSVRSMQDGVPGSSSPGAALTWQSRARTLDLVGLQWRRTATVVDALGAERLPGAWVSPELLAILDVAPHSGSSAGSSASLAPQQILISDRWWRTRFQERPSALGAAVTINGQAFTIVGVLPARVREVLGDVDWLAHLTLAPAQAANFGPRYLEVIARLRPGVALTAAREELGALVPGLDVVITPMAAERVAEHRELIVLLVGGVVLLLGVACANVGGLILADALDRTRELALRASLGATRARLVRQLVAEAALLAAAAGVGGAIVAQWVVAGLQQVLPAEIPRLDAARFGAPEAAFTLLAVTAVIVLCGVVPAWRASRVDVAAALAAASGRIVAGDDRIRRAFVVAQVALSVAIAIAGGLVLRSAWALEEAPRGFDVDDVMLPTVGLPATYDPPAAIEQLVGRVRAAVAEIPGVSGAAVASRLPLGGDSVGSVVALAGSPLSPSAPEARIRLVTGGYAAVTGTRLVAGRDIDMTDAATGQRAVVVNRTLARRLAPDADVVGRALTFEVKPFRDAAPDGLWTIVGVIDDWSDRGPRTAVAPEILMPFAQAPADVFEWMNRQFVLAVRSSRAAAEQSPSIRAAVRQVDPAAPVSEVRPLAEIVRAQFARERSASRLLTLAGGGGLLLAGIGLFAVISHLVRRRALEFALRVALGGDPRRLLRAVIGRGVALAAYGLVAGMIAGAALSTSLASLLFGVHRFDPATYAVVGILVLAGAAAATFLPARATLRGEPSHLLRGR